MCVIENIFRFTDTLLHTEYPEPLQLKYYTSTALNVPVCWVAFSAIQEKIAEQKHLGHPLSMQIVKNTGTANELCSPFACEEISCY